MAARSSESTCRSDCLASASSLWGQSRADSASRLAGRGALVVAVQQPSVTYVGNNPTGPRIGGIGIPRKNGGAVGGGGGDAKVAENKGMTDTKDDPVLLTLREKVLPEGKTVKPFSGLLYFGFDGKQKAKDLELFYRGPAGKFAVRFKN